jgi:hypothetical protein
MQVSATAEAERGQAGDAEREAAILRTENARLHALREASLRFVENASHDFRTPLTVIKEFASIIAEGLAGAVSDEQAEFLQIILDRTEHLSQMVESILVASRLESDAIGVQREAQAVAALVGRVLPGLERRAQAAGLILAVDTSEALPDVFCDGESVCRIIDNLVANACKFTPAGGTVRLQAAATADGDEVAIAVTDTGPGVAAEHVRIIFDRFRQLDGGAADGFGLGLHIASELARVNFGTLSVESIPGRGSTFTLALPVFAVGTLVARHSAFLLSCRRSFDGVTATVATATPGDPAGLDELQRALTRAVPSHDLLIRLGAAKWLLCAAEDAGPASARSARLAALSERLAETSRNRPAGPLPALRFRGVGSWRLAPAAPDASPQAGSIHG